MVNRSVWVLITLTGENLNRRCTMYAIIKTGGKQYKVSEGDLVRVEKLNAEIGEMAVVMMVMVVVIEMVWW